MDVDDNHLYTFVIVVGFVAERGRHVLHRMAMCMLCVELRVSVKYPHGNRGCRVIHCTYIIYFVSYILIMFCMLYILQYIPSEASSVDLYYVF